VVRVRIVKSPKEHDFEPFNVRHLQVGQVYQVGIRLAEFLILEGCAEPQMPAINRVADQ
jgi:hypothetical protein